MLSLYYIFFDRYKYLIFKIIYIYFIKKNWIYMSENNYKCNESKTLN